MRRPLFKPQPQIIIHNHIQDSASIPIKNDKSNKKKNTLVNYIGGYYEDADRCFRRYENTDINVVVIMSDPRRLK